jgi:hypothetical protein
MRKQENFEETLHTRKYMRFKGSRLMKCLILTEK